MKNPLAKYKEENNLSLEDLKDKLGFTKVTTARLVNEGVEALKRKKVETFIIIEKKTGVDMLSYIKNNQ